ncbi:hypothetical protein NQZ79_g5088 [Umbelopsis isabellina]|nr:hypothetical protein NQZ79_g5088 [Umbelopsis isabellina]
MASSNMAPKSQEECRDSQVGHSNYLFQQFSSSERQTQLRAGTEDTHTAVFQNKLQPPSQEPKTIYDNKENYPVSQSDCLDTASERKEVMIISTDQELEVMSHDSKLDPNDTSGSWSIGEFTQDENKDIAHPQSFRDHRLFSQIADTQIDIDDGSSAYSSVLGDLSPRLNQDESSLGYKDENEIEYVDLDPRRELPLENDEASIYHREKKKSVTDYSLVTPSKAIHKPLTFLFPKSNEISLGDSDEYGKSESSKRKQRQSTHGSDGEHIKLEENGLAMKAKKLIDAENQAHSYWDTEVRGYMAQLGSIAYLGPVYPNTELFRILELFDDNGLIHTKCIRIAEPPEELVWTQVSAAGHQSQNGSQANWSPNEVDSNNQNELQLIFFSFANSALSLDMQRQFHQSQMVRIWPPWHEHLLQLSDGSVTTVKLVNRFITDAIY